MAGAAALYRPPGGWARRCGGCLWVSNPVGHSLRSPLDLVVGMRYREDCLSWLASKRPSKGWCGGTEHLSCYSGDKFRSVYPRPLTGGFAFSGSWWAYRVWICSCGVLTVGDARCCAGWLDVPLVTGGTRVAGKSDTRCAVIPRRHAGQVAKANPLGDRHARRLVWPRLVGASD